MAKNTLNNLDTLDIKAKKKKNLFIVIGILSILTVIFTSIGSALLNVDKQKVFMERKQIEADKDMKLIQNPEFKENWAISMENRMEEQEKKAKELFSEMGLKQEKTLSEIKNILSENSKSSTDSMNSLTENLDSKINTLRAELMNRIQEQNDKTQQLELIVEAQKGQVGSSSGDIVIGSDLLPEKSAKNTKQESQINKIEQFLGDTMDSDIKNERGGKVNVDNNSKPENIVENKVLKKTTKIVDIDTSFNAEVITSQAEIEKDFLNKESNNEEKVPDSYHLSTGLSQVYMITGAYAPAFQEGDAEPLPVLFEAEGEIIVPNNYLSSVDKCFLLGSAKGNMNSQTASIKLVSISCLLGDDANFRIEGPISGWVIGENGIPGIHGELLHKNGAWLARTFVSGFLETFANAIGGSGSGTRVVYDTTKSASSDNMTTINDSLTAAGGRGVSTVFNKLGQYYLKMAEQIFPVIEVKGGRTVDILLIGGEDLKVVENSKMDIANINDRLSELSNKKPKENGTSDNNAFSKTILKKSGSSSLLESVKPEPTKNNSPLEKSEKKDYKSIYESNFGKKNNSSLEKSEKKDHKSIYESNFGEGN